MNFDNLYEAKQDSTIFKNWILKKLNSEQGEELFNRFEKLKPLLKSPENDYYYWIKNAHHPEELKVRLDALDEIIKLKRKKKAEISKGAKLVNETEHWKIYSITSYEAAQYYGRDSKWCITGLNGYGDRYWNDYTNKGYTFYFIITKDKYNPWGEDSKFTFAIFDPGECYQIFNQQDTEVELEDVPYYEEIDIPFVSLDEYYEGEPDGYFCDNCEKYLVCYDAYFDPDGSPRCESCWSEKCCECDYCNETIWQEDGLEGPSYEGLYCSNCWSELFVECEDCGDTLYQEEAEYDENGAAYCDDCWDQLQASLDE